MLTPAGTFPNLIRRRVPLVAVPVMLPNAVWVYPLSAGPGAKPSTRLNAVGKASEKVAVMVLVPAVGPEVTGATVSAAGCFTVATSSFELLTVTGVTDLTWMTAVIGVSADSLEG